MTLTKYIIFMLVITLICWTSLIVVIYKIDPFTAGILGFVFFYLTLFFSATTTFSVIGLVFRLWLVKGESAVVQVSTALRQGIWLAILIIGSLILLNLSLLTWWSAALFIVFLAMLEFFFLSYNHR